MQGLVRLKEKIGARNEWPGLWFEPETEQKVPVLSDRPSERPRLPLRWCSRLFLCWANKEELMNERDFLFDFSLSIASSVFIHWRQGV